MGLKSASIRVWDALRFGAAAVAHKLSDSPDATDKRKTGEARLARMLGGYRSGANLGGWNGDPFEQIRHYNHWVYRAIDCIARMVATNPPTVAKVLPNHSTQKGNRSKAVTTNKVTKHARKKALANFRPNEDLEYLPYDHPLNALLRNPNDPDTGGDIWRELILFLELTGLGYLWTVRNGAGRICELWVIPSHWVSPVSLGSKNLIDFYEIRPFDAATGGRSSTPAIFDREELITFRYKSPLSKIGGHAPLQAGAEIVDVYESVQAARYYSCKNGANVGTTIELSADYNPGDNELERFEQKWLQKFAGEEGFGRPAILPSGATLVRPPAEQELAYIQSADQMRDYVFGIWGITKSIAGFIEDVNRAAFVAAMAQFCNHVVNPRTRYIGDVLTEKLCPNYGGNYRLWWDDLTPNDSDAERADTEMLLRNGAMTPNEARSQYGLEPYENGGDDPLVPMGLAPLPLNTGEPPDFPLPGDLSDSGSIDGGDANSDDPSGIAGDMDLNADIDVALRAWRSKLKTSK